MTSPEKLATPDPVIELIEKIAVEWDGCEYDAPGESLDIGDAIRRKGFPLAHALRLATQRQGEGETDYEAHQKNGLAWAVAQWNNCVKNRPLVNIHRRSFDDTWRQVIRYFGGDPDELVGPSHDALLAASPQHQVKKGEPS